MKTLYLRNLIFGVEDSLVSTVGLLSGIAAASTSQHTILLTGSVLITVEAFSMGVGSYLSESYSSLNRDQGSAQGGIIMFLSYILAGLLPLFPYSLLSTRQALPLSISLSLASLFLLGAISSRIIGKRSPARQALKMSLLGGLAITLGVIVGQIIK